MPPLYSNSPGAPLEEPGVTFRNTNARKERSCVLSLQQAAEYLQVSKAHLSNVINGKVPGVKPVRFFRMGRRVLIKREWIDEWLEVAAREALRQ